MRTRPQNSLIDSGRTRAVPVRTDKPELKNDRDYSPGFPV